MGDQAALQEAIQRARQLAAKITQSAPVKRPASTSDHSGPVKVTLAYEKPANSDHSKQHESSHHRSSSRDYNKTDRESRDSRDARDSRDSRERGDARDFKDTRDSREHRSDYRDNNHNRESSRDSNRNLTHQGSMLGGNNSHYQNEQPLLPPSSSRSGEEKIEIIIPHAVIGLVIGKGGENIKRIQNESGATVRVDPNTVDEKGNKLCTITGTKQAVDEAHIQVSNVIENAATNKRPRMQTDSTVDAYRMKIPASRTGAIIGKGGETIKSIKQQSGCDIELDKSAPECGPDESVFIIRGSQDKISKAKSMIEARLASRGRDGGKEYHNDSHSNRGGPKAVATGANAAPVAQFTDLPSSYPAAGQQNTAGMSAAWLAYFEQYAHLSNQAGAQPGSAGAMAYGGQPSLLGSAAGASVAPSNNHQASQLDQSSQQHQQLQQPEQQSVDANQSGQPQADYSDQWIQYYLAHNRPDYAEQIMQLKKQQQAQKQQQ